MRMAVLHSPAQFCTDMTPNFVPSSNLPYATTKITPNATVTTESVFLFRFTANEVSNKKDYLYCSYHSDFLKKIVDIR